MNHTDRLKKLAKVFTPGAPPARDFLCGRDDDIAKITELLSSPGLHPIVIGPRGIGKTSLIRNLNLEGIKIHKPHTCGGSTAFQDIAVWMLKLVGYEVDLIESSDKTKSTSEFSINAVLKGSRKERTEKSSRRRGLGSRILSPWTVFELVSDANCSDIFLIDEFDAIKNGETCRQIAELIKTFADNSSDCAVRMVISGIAMDMEHLFEGHESITRCAKEVYLHPLNDSSVREFLRRAEGALGLKFDVAVISQIIENSLGMPAFVQLVGHHSVLAMWKRSPASEIVNQDDLVRGWKNANAEAVRYWKFFTTHYLDSFSSDARTALAVVVRHKGRVSKGTLIDQLMGIGFDEARAAKAIEELFSRNLAGKTSSGELVMHDRLLVAYLAWSFSQGESH